jgi:ATP-dependent Clp protease, protease subunit
MTKNNLKISVSAEANKAIIRIDGGIYSWRNSAPDFKTQLDNLIIQGYVNADIYINSPGGDCFQANEIANEILRFTGVTNAYLGALCASAGTYIACKCNKVTGAKNVSYMIHKPMTNFTGNSDQVKADLKLLENLQSDYANTYAEKTGLPVSKIESLWTQDYWMNSEEALKLGFIDEIEGEATITEQDVLALKAYKNAPNIIASATQNQNLTNLNTQMKESLITVLALVATATDAQIIAQIDILKSKAAKADALETELDALKKATNEKEVAAVLKTALDGKKITAAQEPYFKKHLTANFEETKAVLESMTPMVKLSEQTEGNTGSIVDRSKWTYADYQDKDPKALASLAKNDESSYKELAQAHYGPNFKF